ncbi:L-ascorbate oxidase-like [Papaver somniferum]|uniref:L-ascorbate oxidase-like n=1 Tax=Papaver somniferum TaxID=3469 RepID=UPI000E6F7C2F|nr:L-ascorbate oxidase-like [Papaver somniferum]
MGGLFISLRRSHTISVLVTIMFLTLFFENPTVDAAEMKTYNWEVAYMKWSPDCVENTVIGINGQFPGPEIRAKAGDTIVVNLSNKLNTKEGLVIHWHGIRQLDTPWADGTASVSQCAINPGATFQYRFIVDRAGTYFYHGHYEMQRAAGLYGSLIVDVADGKIEPFPYHGEINLLLSDWWHQSAHDQEVALSSNPFRWIGEPQSILINGRGQYNCSIAAKYDNTTNYCNIYGRPSDQCEPYALTVEPSKFYRLRIASTTSLASLNLVIANHRMILVEADGNYLQPKYVTNLDIYSGESYSVILNTGQDPSVNYWVSLSQRGRKPPFPPPALTILNYKPNSVFDVMPSSPPPLSPAWDDLAQSRNFTNKVLGLQVDGISLQPHPSAIPRPPVRHDRRIFLLNTQIKIDGYVKWSVNNISLVLPTTPYLGSLKFGLKNGFNATTPPETFPSTYDITKPPANPNSTYGSGVYNFKHMEIVDVILQNANALGEGVSEIHPWHLHGHDFWVLGYGDGKFSEENDEKNLNLVNPPLRNTVVVFPYGWTAIRFIADNPGVWPFHCHIEPHLHMGMGVIFAVAADKIKQIPNGVLDCGLTATTAPTISNNAVGPLVRLNIFHYVVHVALLVISIPCIKFF